MGMILGDLLISCTSCSTSKDTTRSKVWQWGSANARHQPSFWKEAKGVAEAVVLAYISRTLRLNQQAKHARYNTPCYCDEG